jgi:hypothetical protein
MAARALLDVGRIVGQCRIHRSRLPVSKVAAVRLLLAVAHFGGVRPCPTCTEVKHGVRRPTMRGDVEAISRTETDVGQ